MALRGCIKGMGVELVFKRGTRLAQSYPAARGGQCKILTPTIADATDCKIVTLCYTLPLEGTRGSLPLTKDIYLSPSFFIHKEGVR
jgi:hypothetical protein